MSAATTCVRSRCLRVSSRPACTRQQVVTARYVAPEHQTDIAVLRERLTDPGFAPALTPLERSELKLLAAAPLDFISCTARLAKEGLIGGSQPSGAPGYPLASTITEVNTPAIYLLRSPNDVRGAEPVVRE